MKKNDSASNHVLIHLGYHKTGTSYLQKYIFNDADAGFFSPVERHFLRNTFVGTNPFQFDTDEIRDLLHFQTNESPKNLIPVLSNEQFSGQPYGGGYGLRKREREVSRKEIADRLYSCFPDARILVVIREQREMIRSIYKFLVCGWHGRLSATIEEFLDQSPLEDGYSPLFKLDYLEYHWLIKYYQKLFGKSSVLVLPFERFRDDPVYFVNQIRRFVSLEPVENVPEKKVNVGYSAATCNARRVINRLIVSPNKPGLISNNERRAAKLTSKLNRYIPQSFHEKTERKLASKIDQIVDGYYNKSNQETASLTKIDLESLGYQVQD